MSEGSRVRTVVDTTPTVQVSKCLAWINDDRHLCFRNRGHIGGHLPLPRRWATTDVTPDNPKWAA